MRIVYTEQDLRAQEYEHLRAQVGWAQFSRRQTEVALKNSLYLLCARQQDGTAVGMGRLVGDAATICYVQDLIVLPQFHGQGLGGELLLRLEAHVRALLQDGESIKLGLMCAKGKESFYQRFGFYVRPTPQFGPGMMQCLKQEKSAKE